MDLAELTGVRVARTEADLALAPGEAYLGGGSWLYSTPQPHVTRLVDLAGLGWAPVEERADGGVRIAGTCTVAELVAAAAGWAPVRADAAALVRDCAEAFLMSAKVWRVATVGGNLCLALPAGAMISLAVALEATVELVGPAGTRQLPAVDLVTGPGATRRAPDEVLRAVDVEPAALTARYALRRMSLAPAGRSSAVVVARRDERDGCHLSLTAAVPRPVVLRLPGRPDAAAARAAVRDLTDWYADPHGPADWRAAVSEELAVAALAAVAPGEAA
ncbi:FAD binding domain-containing protein [Nocardioides zeae]|uniref:FAD binding domain-containing protein n=1 Tax=Nocardioides imazamoxiresistens TaxID=3231893 RepID=A0ABU3PQK9_9ACTN|nr:FAD binding domain-containing protein [Nocardioides zeae]MDT9591499.1 FAD binding domain-containing protein [Nocardioides zeae]